MICYIKSNIFTVTDVTVLDSGTCSLTTNTYCRANCACTSDDTVINNRATIYCNL